MPGSFAHFALGCLCLERLPHRLQGRLTDHEEMFFVGLHGPDIFFYYRPLLSGRLETALRRLHSGSPNGFFAHGRAVAESNGREVRDAAFAYLCGYLCHYYLDAFCHEYISRQNRRNAYLTFYHYKTERAFDIYLESRLSHRLSGFPDKFHRDVPPFGCAVIARLYADVLPSQIMNALRGHSFFCGLNHRIEKLFGVCFDHFGAAADMRAMTLLFKKAVSRSVMGIQELEGYIYSGSALPGFGRDFKGREI